MSHPEIAQPSRSQIINQPTNTNILAPPPRRLNRLRLHEVLHLPFHVLLHQDRDRFRRWEGAEAKVSGEGGEWPEPALERGLWWCDGWRVAGFFDAILGTAAFGMSDDDHWRRIANQCRWTVGGNECEPTLLHVKMSHSIIQDRQHVVIIKVYLAIDSHTIQTSGRKKALI